MINLLPPQQKKEILESKYFTLVLNWEFLILSFLIFLSLTLFLLKIFIANEIKLVEISLAEKEKEISLYQNLEKEIESSNLLISELYSFYQRQKDFPKIIEEISKSLPPGIYLKNLNFSASQKELLVSLSGFSPSRELLFSLRENLENNKKFFDIYFPIENWLSPTNIDFSVQFKIK